MEDGSPDKIIPFLIAVRLRSDRTPSSSTLLLLRFKTDPGVLR